MRHDLHWLDISDRTQFRVAVLMYHSINGSAAEHLSELFTPVSNRSSQYSLRSAHNNQLVQLPARLSTYEGRSFSVSGPTVQNSLHDLRDPLLSLDSFRRFLTTFCLLATNFCDALQH